MPTPIRPAALARRRGLVARLAALVAASGTAAAAPPPARPAAPPAPPARKDPPPPDFFGAGAVSVLSFGAVGDGVHDDSDAFRRACEAAGLNGVVVVPRAKGAYRVRRTIPLASRSLAGVGWPVITLDAGDTPTDLLEISVEDGVYDQWHQGGVVSGLVLNGGGSGRDLIRVTGADSVQIRDVRLIDAGRDGLHVEGAAKWRWTESLNLVNAFASGSRRDNFHLAVPPEFNFTFVNQTSFLNCKSRAPGRYALACVNRSREGGDSAKISQVSWINGELDATGGAAGDIVLLQTLGPGVIELVNFSDVAIEDVRAQHAGYGIGIDAGGGGAVRQVQARNCIFYGAAAGWISPASDAPPTPPRAPEPVLPGGFASGQTELLAAGRSVPIGAAGGRLQKIFASAAGDRGVAACHGEWTLFGSKLAPVIEMGCALRIVDGRMLLQNATRNAAVFEWYVQTVG